LLFEQKNFDAAKNIFQELIQIDEDADFAIEAREYLEKIKNEEKKMQDETNGSGSTITGTTNSSTIPKNNNFWDF
jgi:hypothetical protein